MRVNTTSVLLWRGFRNLTQYCSTETCTSTSATLRLCSTFHTTLFYGNRDVLLEDVVELGLILSTQHCSTETVIEELLGKVEERAFHTTLFYGNPTKKHFRESWKASFHTTLFYGNKIKNGKLIVKPKIAGFPHNTVLRKHAFDSDLAAYVRDWPFHTTLFYGNPVDVLNGETPSTAFHTTLFYGNVLFQEFQLAEDVLLFPHNTVLRKPSGSWPRRSTRIGMATFHTTLFYGNHQDHGHGEVRG